MQRPIYWFILIFIIGISACTSTQDKSSNPFSSKNKTNGIFIEGVEVRTEDNYKDIKGNVARLQAMLCGRFTHHVIPKTDSTQSIYKVWLVNDGKDSVVHYHLPVGNKNREGYWVYIHQCLTSLPDDPTYNVLAKFEEIDRDTILSKRYALPEDFEINLKAIIEDPKDYFSSIDLLKLGKEKPGSIYNYLRKSPLNYLGEGEIFVKEVKNTPIKFIRRYYDITPKQIMGFKVGYNSDTLSFTRTKGEYYLREAMVDPEVFLK